MKVVTFRSDAVSRFLCHGCRDIVRMKLYVIRFDNGKSFSCYSCTECKFCHFYSYKPGYSRYQMNNTPKRYRSYFARIFRDWSTAQ